MDPAGKESVSAAHMVGGWMDPVDDAGSNETAKSTVEHLTIDLCPLPFPSVTHFWSTDNIFVTWFGCAEPPRCETTHRQDVRTYRSSAPSGSQGTKRCPCPAHSRHAVSVTQQIHSLTHVPFSHSPVRTHGRKPMRVPSLVDFRGLSSRSRSLSGARALALTSVGASQHPRHP